MAQASNRLVNTTYQFVWLKLITFFWKEAQTMKLDVKSVVIGVLCSVTLMFVFGYTSTSEMELFAPQSITWAMVVPASGKVLARADDGTAFVIDVGNSKAKKVEYDPKKTSVLNDILVLSGQD